MFPVCEKYAVFLVTCPHRYGVFFHIYVRVFTCVFSVCVFFAPYYTKPHMSAHCTANAGPCKGSSHGALIWALARTL